LRAYADSCVVIYFVEGPDEIRGQLARSFEALDDAPLCVSDLVRLECRVAAVRARDHSLLEEYDQFFANADFITLDRAVYDLATELRAEHRLKTPDAIHVAAAIAKWLRRVLDERPTPRGTRTARPDPCPAVKPQTRSSAS